GSLRQVGRELGQRPRQHARRVATSALGPRAILGGDEGRESLAVVVGGDRRQAAAPDCKDARPLGLDAPAGLGMVGARNKLLFPHAYLKRKRPLAGLRQQVIRLEATADLGGQAETVEPAG